MLTVLGIALLTLGAILVALAINRAYVGDMPSQPSTGLRRISTLPLMRLLIIATVCLALGPGPPQTSAGSSNASCTIVAIENGASIDNAITVFNP